MQNFSYLDPRVWVVDQSVDEWRSQDFYFYIRVLKLIITKMAFALDNKNKTKIDYVTRKILKFKPI